MPISKENKSKYPNNWKQISLDIRTKADNKCQFCGIENHSIGYRDKDGSFIELQPSHQVDIDIEENNLKLIKIVLTVAHLDHNPENNQLENLKALCQKCHLNYDKFHHLESRQKNKYQNQVSIFEVKLWILKTQG